MATRFKLSVVVLVIEILTLLNRTSYCKTRFTVGRVLNYVFGAENTKGLRFQSRLP